MHRNKTDPAGYNDPKAPVYLVAGAAGNIEGLTKNTKYPDGFLWGSDSDYAYAQIEVHNRTHISFAFFNSSDGAQIDNATLYKSHKHAFH